MGPDVWFSSGAVSGLRSTCFHLYRNHVVDPQKVPPQFSNSVAFHSRALYVRILYWLETFVQLYEDPVRAAWLWFVLLVERSPHSRAAQFKDAEAAYKEVIRSIERVNTSVLQARPETPRAPRAPPPPAAAAPAA